VAYMNLYKDPRTQSYYIRYSRSEAPPNGKTVSLKQVIGHTVYDKDEAGELFQTLKKRMLEGKIFELDKAERIKLSQLSTEFVKARPDLSNDTLRMDALAIRRLIDCVGDKSVKAVNNSDLIKSKNIWLGQKLSPHSIKSYFRHIKAALNFAKDQDYREKLPKFPKVKTGKRHPKVIRSDDLQNIKQCAWNNDRELWRYVQFALFTGCRLSECINLRWNDVEIYDRPSGSSYGRLRINGKGNRDRNIPILTQTMKAMGDTKDIGPVFKQMHEDTLSHRFHKVVVKCGLTDKKYSFHSLRHTAATQMVEAGIKLEIIQKILGHSDIQTTQIYAQIYDQVVEDEMGKMG